MPYDGPVVSAPPQFRGSRDDCTHRIEIVWEYLRGKQLSNTVYESYDEIVIACCDAWNFFADDSERVATITTRSWSAVDA